MPVTMGYHRRWQLCKQVLVHFSLDWTYAAALLSEISAKLSRRTSKPLIGAHAARTAEAATFRKQPIDSGSMTVPVGPPEAVLSSDSLEQHSSPGRGCLFARFAPIQPSAVRHARCWVLPGSPGVSGYVLSRWYKGWSKF